MGGLRACLRGGPWMVLGHYITITKWRPNFTPSETTAMNTLVWVRFPQLPLEMFLEKTLRGMGDTIGRTVKVDMTTTDVTRGCFARVCIELDLRKSLIPTVMIIGRVIHVEYEGLPKICFSCGLYGYGTTTCLKLSTMQEPTTGENLVVLPEKTKSEGSYGS